MMGRDSKVGEFLGRTLEKRQLSLRGMANLAGISHAYVSRLIHKKTTSPSVDTLFRIADALEIPRMY